jgi:hypothetical protein
MRGGEDPHRRCEFGVRAYRDRPIYAEGAVWPERASRPDTEVGGLVPDSSIQPQPATHANPRRQSTTRETIDLRSETDETVGGKRKSDGIDQHDSWL